MLASASPRRLELLAQIGISPDRVIPPGVDERPERGEIPRHYARRLARAKAAAVSARECFVLAADTVVSVGRRILPKAETADQAHAALALLAGRRHRVITAVVVRGPDGRLAERVVVSTVGFARLSQAQIESYVESNEWQGKAGGYAVQGRAAANIRFLSGSHSNVIGLPLFETAQLLRGFGYPVP